MSAELIAILALGAGMVTAFLAFAGLILTLINQSNKESRQRTERLEDQMNRGFEQLRNEMNHQTERLRAEMNQKQEETNHGFEQLRTEMNQKQEETNRGLEQLRAEMNQGFAQQDARIRNLEQGQAYMSGQFSELKDHLTHRSDSGNNPDPGD